MQLMVVSVNGEAHPRKLLGTADAAFSPTGQGAQPIARRISPSLRISEARLLQRRSRDTHERHASCIGIDGDLGIWGARTGREGRRRRLLHFPHGSKAISGSWLRGLRGIHRRCARLDDLDVRDAFRMLHFPEGSQILQR